MKTMTVRQVIQIAVTGGVGEGYPILYALSDDGRIYSLVDDGDLKWERIQTPFTNEMREEVL